MIPFGQVAQPSTDLEISSSANITNPVRSRIGLDAASAGHESIYRPVSPQIAITPTISVIIPARNEAANLPFVFASMPAWIHEVILVDGRSTDDTIAVAQHLWPTVKVVAQKGNGKGDALQAGFAASTGDIIVMMDADGSTDGREILQFVAALLAGADFAKGSRFACGGGSSDITWLRGIGNGLLTRIVNIMFGTRYSDLCYGFNAFWSDHLDELAVECAGFEVETLMNIRAARAGMRVHEVPSFEHSRLHGVSNLHVVADGWRIAKVIGREWLRMRRIERGKSASAGVREVSERASLSSRTLPD